MDRSCETQRQQELDTARREAMAFAGIGLYRYRFDGAVTLLDAGAFRLFELEDFFSNPREAEGKKLSELLVYTGPEGRMRAALSRQPSLRDQEWSFRTLRGNDKWVVEDSYRVTDPDTGEETIQVIIRDITERRKAEEALAASERRFHEVLESIPLIAVQFDLEGRITFCNAHLCALSGWTPPELLGRDWFETFIPPEMQDEMHNILGIARGSAPSPPPLLENTIVTRTGERRLVLWSSMFLQGPNNGIAGITSIGQDITARKQAEEMLRNAIEVSEKLRELAAVMNVCHGVEAFTGPLCKAILDVCQVDGCAVHLVEGDRLTLYHQEGLPLDYVRQVAALPLASPVVLAVAASEQPCSVGPLLTAELPGYKRHRIKWAYWCPIYLGAELLGVLSVASSSIEPPPERLRLLSMIAMETSSLLNRLRAEDILRESEAQYRVTLDAMTDAIHVIDRNYKIVLINRRFTEWMDMIGIPGAAPGRSLFEVFHFLPEKVRGEYARVFQTGISFGSEEITEVATHVFHTETHKIPIFRRGAVHQVLTVVQNITERKTAENALVESEAKYRTLVEMFPFGLAIFQNNRVVFANEAIRTMFRYGRIDDFLGQDIMGVVAPEDRARLHAYVRDRGLKHANAPEHYEAVFTRADGEKFPAEVYIRAITYQGQPSYQVLVSDISERKRAEEALRRSEERYRNILESMQEGYYEVDLLGNFTFFNASMCRMIGYPQEELLGMNYRRYYPDEATIEKVRSTFAEVYEKRKALQLSDWRIIRKDGKEAVWEVSISLKHDDNGNINGFRGIVRDVTDRKEAEQALQKAEFRYRELFENANDIIYTHDLTGRLTSLNKAGERISGYTREEILDKNVLDIVVPKFQETARAMVRRKVLQEDQTQYESAILAKDGRIIPVEVSTRLILESGKPAGIQGIARDITERKQAEEERKRLEAQIQHTQKLEGLGVLAGGIAHDFNNLLVGVLGNAGLALSRLAEESPARLYVRRIEETAQRAAELTNQMLAYSGRGTFLVRPVCLSKLAQEMGPLLTASISKKAMLRYDCAPDLPLIKGDMAQLHQILINLITNASDALGDASGAITISTYVTHVDQLYLKKAYIADMLEEGPYVCLAVSDTGCGMDAETLSRIFDPFFSTKFAGRGLGLAAVLGIVRSHHGTITVYSEPGQGTTFKVLFPVAQCPENGRIHAQCAAQESDVQSWRGDGSILVADDEEGVLDVAEEALTQHGFRVLKAANGREAVEIYQKHRGEIAAILLDLTMPIMSGQEAFDVIRAIDPATPIILSSGYTEQDAAERLDSGRPSAFIQKPYRPQDLLRVIRRITTQ